MAPPEAVASDMSIRAQIEKNVCDDNKRLFRTNAHLLMSTSDIEKLVAPDPVYGKDAYLEASQYCVSDVIPGTKTMRYFHVLPDVATVQPLAEYVETTYEGEAADIAEGLRAAIAPELKVLENQKKLADSIFWNKVMMGAMLYITGKQMGLTQRLDGALTQLFQAVVETPKRILAGDLAGIKPLWTKTFKPSSPIVRDFTEEVRHVNVPLTDTAREILRDFDRGAFPHVRLTGPSGGGKGHAVRAAAAAAVQGLSGVEAFEGQPVRYVRISAGQVVKEAGSWMNKAEQLFFQAIDRYAGNGPVIIHLTEADQFANAGMGPGNQPLNLLSKILEVMEGTDPRYRSLHFILDSTRWEVILNAAPDIRRRAGSVEIIPPSVVELRQALEDGLQWRRSGGEGYILQRRYSRASFTTEALDAITALGHYEDGAPPSSHLATMDGLVAEVTRSGGTAAGSVQITADHVAQYVANQTNRGVAEVQDELAVIRSEGLPNNVRVQQSIEEAFYKAYPNPANGRKTRIPGGAAAVAAPSAAPGSSATSSTNGAIKAQLEAELAKHFKSWSSLTPERKEIHFTALARSWNDGTPAMRWAYRIGSGIDVARLAQDYYRHSLEKRPFDQRNPTEAEKAEDRMRRERELKSFKGLPI